MSVYPALPARRMAYDRDGSVGFRHKEGDSVITILSGAQLEAINDEKDISYYDPNTGADYINVGFVFPELRDLVAYFAFIESGWHSSRTLKTSVDSTNGFDGTWVDQGSFTNSAGTQPGYRSGIVTLGSPITGIKAVKFGAGFSANAARYNTIHLYGEIASGQTPDRLRLWHPTLDEEIDGNYFNFNDVAQGSSSTKDFRVKNNSDTLTANTITLSLEALTDASPSMVDDFSLSTISISTLAAGSVSSVLTLTRNTASDAALSLWSPRIVISAETWT